EISALSDRELNEIFADVPSVDLPRAGLESPGLGILDALVKGSLVKSNGEARRTIEQGGAYVNNVRVGSVDTRLSALNLASESVIVLRTGKKKYALLRF